MNNQSAGTITTSIVDTEEDFRDLAQAWNRLAQAAGGSLFFQHEWFHAAWAWRKLDSSLFILIAWREDTPIGILPLVHIRDGGRFPPLRSLEFLAVPDTQSCDLIAAEGDRERVTEAFCEALHSRRRSWDRIALTYLVEGAAALNGINAGFDARGYACRVQPHERNLYVSLDSEWDAYYTSRSRSLKKANNLAANRLKKAGEIVVRCITPATANAMEIQRTLKQIIDISQQSWKRDTGYSLDQPGPGGFITTLTEHAVRRGWLSLWMLSINSKPVAMEYQLIHAGNVYALRADFDAEFEEVSPGSHLMRTLLESLFSDGLRRYYMGPGGNAYKARWTDEGDSLHQMIVQGRTWRGRLIRVWDDVLKPLARSMRKSFASKKSQPALCK